MLEANRMLLERLEAKIDGDVDDKSRIDGRVVIGKGSTVKNSVLRGPLIIGENTSVTDSYIGPFTSINYNVEVRGSEIEHSIVLEDSRILDVGGRIEGSLVGKNVVIEKHSAKPRAYRFMVGDYSRIELE
jgi:glucose-1-phosphate thymidylyltransferase